MVRLVVDNGHAMGFNGKYMEEYLPAIPFRQKLRLSMLGGQNMIYQSGFRTKSSAIDTHTQFLQYLQVYTGWF